MFKRSFALLMPILCAYVFNGYAQNGANYVAIDPADTRADIINKAANVRPSERQLRWQQLELTGFLHFGINTFTNNEWGNGKEDPALFNPTNLDAEQWVRVCKEAGIKQVIITAKHHDGFCLWPSKYTEHSVKNSPWKNGKGDVVKEVAEACKKYKIGFGIYLSPWDRNSTYYGDTEKYNAYFLNQLTELLSNYGKVDEVWLDGANGEGPNGKKQVYDFDSWYKLIRKLQPGAVIANLGPDARWVGTETGVGRLSEWSVLPVSAQLQQNIAAGSQKDVTFAPKGFVKGEDMGARDKIMQAKGLVWYPAETDVSIRPGWFYHPAEDAKVKSPQKLMDIYCTSVGRNGVMLLNIPPDKDGLISKSDIKNLQDWKQLRDETFKHNLLKPARIQSGNGLNIKALLDDQYKTYWTTTGKDSTATIEFDLPAPVSFDMLQLQENIAVGQRIEKFVLEYNDGTQWKEIVMGTTVGFKRIIGFDAVTSDKVRLVIASSRLNPTLSSIGLFKQAGK
jgi:alpha-L-fucosidase